MVLRSGFVSNSSSSSFVVGKSYITAKQRDQIFNHISVSHVIDPDKKFVGYAEPESAWDVEEDADTVYGCTSMDNFNMREFLVLIGVDLERVRGLSQCC